MAHPSPVVALHNHTEYSSFDGLQRLGEMCDAVAADPAWERAGVDPACAITDHGTIGGAWKFAKEARKRGIKPILGMEAYLAIGSRTEQRVEEDLSGTDADEKGGFDDKDERKKRRYHHLTMHALNPAGWKNLLRISNEAHDHYWYKPRTDLDFIGQHNEGLMIGTGCLGGPVASRLLAGDPDGARSAVERLLDVVGGDRNRLFIEVMSHGLNGTHGMPDEDGKVLPGLADLAREFNLRMVATNDSHFTHRHQSGWIAGPGGLPQGMNGAHDVWLAVGVNREIDDPTRFHFQGEGYWMKTAEEMNQQMARFSAQFGDQDPVANTLWVAEQVEDNVMAESRLRLPQFPLDPDKLSLFMHERGAARARFSSDTEFYLHEMVRRGAIERYGSPLPSAVKERLAYEMGVIGNAGLWDYFLIVADMIDWARRQGIMSGPGRGSAAGSAVSYCLRIVDVDPIANGLLFERFLDPYRAGMPDIDSDFDQEGRDRVIGYLMEKYGEDHVARIGTFGTMGVKKAVRDIARLLPDVDTTVGADLAGQVPVLAGKPLSFAKLLDPANPLGMGFREVMANHPDAKRVVELARPMEGIITSEGIHACGVLVSAEPLDTLVPTRRDQKSKFKTRVTTWEAHDVEELGLLKLDDLGLRTLDIVSATLDMVKESTGEKIDTSYGVLPMDGESDRRARAAWDLITSGKTQGIFQLEGSGMAKLCQGVQPESLEDLSAVVALYRPGPLGTGMHERYVARKHGHEPVSYDYLTRDPAEQEVIASVLGATHGVVAYQEQIMELSALVAGFGPGKKNKLRKAFSKKIREEMEALKADFIAGAQVATVDDFGKDTDTSASIVFKQSTAEELWRTFDASAEYLFNKCVTGDALLFTGRGTGPKAETWTIEDLYHRLHGDDSTPTGTCQFCGERESTPRTNRCKRCMSWHTKFRDSRGFSVLALDSTDGRIRPQRVADVHANGVKPVLAVMTADGRTVKVTGNHRLMTPGGWREAQHLNVGDELIVHGGYQDQEWEPEKIRTTVGERNRTGYVGGPTPEQGYNFIDGGFMALSDWTRRTIATAACSVCGKTKAQARLERAHLDGDRTNNADENLAWMCVGHHKQHDYQVNGRRRRWEKGHIATTSQIVSITPAGTEMTYDVEMAAGTDHNFIANGIVSHNSHSAGYGYLAYVTAFLKANWPAQYGAALLSVTKDDEKRLATLGYLRDEGLAVLGPDVNLGGVKTSVDASGAIRLGMAEVKGVGLNSGAIVAERDQNGPFTSLADLMNRVKVTTTKASNEVLAKHLSKSDRICHECLSLIGIERDIAGAPDDDTTDELIAQRDLFGACTCEVPRTTPDVDDEKREFTRPDGATVVISPKKKPGGKFSTRYQLYREDIKPETDDDGNPVMVQSNLSSGLVEALIEAGACDSFGATRAGMLAVLRVMREIPDIEVPTINWGHIEESKRERKRLGMVASGSPLGKIGNAVIREWAKQAQVDGLRASELVPLSALDDQMDYAVTIGVVSSWETRPYSGGTMARITLEGSKGSLSGVVWDSGISQLHAAMGREVELGDILAVSGRIKSTERRKASPANDVVIDTETGEELDERFVVQETETVREISIQRAWLADLNLGQVDHPQDTPFAYQPPTPAPSRRPGAQAPLPFDGDDPADGPGGAPEPPDGDDGPEDPQGPPEAPSGPQEPDPGTGESPVPPTPPRASQGDWDDDLLARSDIDAILDGLLDEWNGPVVLDWRPADDPVAVEHVSLALPSEPAEYVEHHSVDLDEPVDRVADGPIVEGADWTGIAPEDDWERPDPEEEPDEPPAPAEPPEPVAKAVARKTHTYYLNRHDAAQPHSKSWRWMRTLLGEDIISEADRRKVCSWAAASLPNRSFHGESRLRHDRRYQYPEFFDLPDGSQLVLQARDPEEFGEEGWTPALAVIDCMELVTPQGRERLEK